MQLLICGWWLLECSGWLLALVKVPTSNDILIPLYNSYPSLNISQLNFLPIYCQIELQILKVEDDEM